MALGRSGIRRRTWAVTGYGVTKQGAHKVTFFAKLRCHFVPILRRLNHFEKRLFLRLSHLVTLQKESVLTYISTADLVREAIRENCDADRLRLVETMIPGSRRRVIYAEAEFHAVLMDPANARMGQLRRDFDRFTLGEFITVGTGNDDVCQMKQLDPASDEMWEIRSRAPKPSLRVFGRFIAADVFIATNYATRNQLRGRRSREFAVEIAKCRAIWSRLFPYCPAHRGDNINDYISDNARALANFR